MTRSSNGQPKPVSGILRNSRDMASLLAQARAYTRLENQLMAGLPTMLQGGRIRVACVREDCLVIAAQSAGWATRARTMEARILEEARRHWEKPLNRIRIIVATAGS